MPLSNRGLIMIRIFYINFEYFSNEEFEKIEEAIIFAVSKCFEVSFYKNTYLIGTWSPIGGYKEIN